MATLMQDVRYGLRMLMRNPTSTIVALLALALGIGANTAIFSVVNSVLLRPLAYEDPARLVMMRGTKPETADSDFDTLVSPDDFVDYRDRNRAFTSFAAASTVWSLTLTGVDEAERVESRFVSASLFPLLGVRPALGRGFLPEEDRPGSTAGVIVISDGCWRSRFASEPRVIGRTIALNGVARTIVGVMPAGFRFLEDVDVWVPLALNPLQSRGRVVRYLTAVGRLAPGATTQRAEAEMQSIAAQLAEQYPDSNRGFSVHLVPLHEHLTGNVRQALWILLGAVGFVLLIACANVANLMLARAVARRKEIAIRVALGAGRTRLLRQLFTESVTLSLLGGLAGLLVANWSLDALLSISPATLPRRAEIAIDPWALAFTLLAALITGLVFGLAPALVAARGELHTSLKEGGRSGDGGDRRRLRGLFVVSEVALALVLLAGSGLLVRSFLRVLDVNPGFAVDTTLTVSTLLPTSKYGRPEQRAALYSDIEQRLRTIRGVREVGTVSRLPLLGSNLTSSLAIEGRTFPAGERPEVEYRIASGSYFRAMGIPLRRGRFYDERDDRDPTTVVLINESTARRYWPNEDPIDKRIQLAGASKWITIIGVVGDVRHVGLDVAPRPEIYRPYLNNPLTSPILVIRAEGDPREVIAAVRAQIRNVDADLPLYNIHPMRTLVERAAAGRRFPALLVTGFSALALLLAAVGIYGVMAQSAAQRTREIGLRMALGARAGDVMRLVLAEGMILAGIGIVLGLAAAGALTRFLSTLLFGVGPADPVVFAGAPVVVALVAFAACYLPARRAARVDPMVALRYE